MIRVLQYLKTVPGGWFPQPDGVVPSATGKQPPIGTPGDTNHKPMMCAQHPGRRLPGHIPDDHQPICASADQVHTIGTPVKVVQPDRVALHDAHALTTGHIPHPDGAIFASTEQAAPLGPHAGLVTPPPYPYHLP